jgi:hypothetical protein
MDCGQPWKFPFQPHVSLPADISSNHDYNTARNPFFLYHGAAYSRAAGLALYINYGTDLI